MLIASCMMACTAEDTQTPGVESKSIIVYDVQTSDVVTRGEAMSNATFAKVDRTFKLWAWMTDATGTYPAKSDHNPNPIQAVDITYNGTAWEASQTYYWPRPRFTSVDFYAVYDPNQDYSFFRPDSKTFDFTGTNAVEGDADIMYATYSDRRTERGTATSKTAHLKFNHVMSQVQFKANRASELAVTINSIEICNVNSQGTFTLTDNAGWDVSQNALKNFTLPLKAQLIELDKGEAGIQLLNPEDNALMLIPQTRSKWDKTKSISANNSGDKGCYLKIGCSVEMGGKDYANEGYIYFPFDIEWEAGKCYTYILGFGTGYDSNGKNTLTEISLKSVVTDWVDGKQETSEDIYI